MGKMGFASDYFWIKFHAVKTKIDHKNVTIALLFIGLVIVCSILRTIVMNPDYITQAIIAYEGDEVPLVDLNVMIINANYSTVLLKDMPPQGNESETSEIDLLHMKTKHKHKGERAEKRLPQCIIAGTRKGGTGVLLDALNIHPDVVVAQKEQHFFNSKLYYAMGQEAYRRNMPLSYKSQITIEKTPEYFTSYWAPYRIKQMNDSIKILVIVRAPVVRAISEYMQFDLKNGKTKTFEHYATTKSGRVNKKNRHLHLSQYYYFTRRWLSLFSREQLHFVNGEELIRKPVMELGKIETFLGLSHVISNAHFYSNDKRNNCICWKTLTAKEKCFSNGKGSRYLSHMNPNVTQLLVDHFRSYNKMFFDLIGEEFMWPS